MRIVLLSAVVLLPLQAFAFSGEEAAAVYNDFRPACRQSELDGKEISSSESQKYCVALEAIGEQLKANGWCFDPSGVEWNKCED